MKTIITIIIILFANTSYAGDKFTKISASGAELSDGATEWSCVKQNYSGLIWEVKTNFTRYTTSEAQEYKNHVNSKGLCGYSNWQIPSRDMLHDIYLNNNETLDTGDEYLSFFPYIRQ